MALSLQPGCDVAKLANVTHEEAKSLNTNRGATIVKELAKDTADLKILAFTAIDGEARSVPLNQITQFAAEQRDTYEDAIGTLPGVVEIADLTPELRKKARSLKKLGVALDDADGNLTYDRMVANPNYTGAADYKASEERQVALLQAAHYRRLAGENHDYADVQGHVALVETKCPITAETLQAKARFEAGNVYANINTPKPTGADYYAAAALALAANNDPALADFNAVKLVAMVLLGFDTTNKTPPAADVAANAIRLFAIANPNMANIDEVGKFAQNVLGATYLARLGYGPNNLDAAGLVLLKTLKHSLRQLGDIGPCRKYR